MDPRTLDLAAEFCSLVGSPDLLTYLGAQASDEAATVRAKLKKRRKYMQGMQGNPKYKKEALFLIKHFGALNDVLGDVDAYLADTRRRAESEHLPVLEMTVRGVLAGGGLTPEQEQFLRHNAMQLGISEATFEDILRKLAKEAGVPLVGGLPTPPPAPTRGQATDLYAILGVDAGATASDIALAYQQKRTESEVSGEATPDYIRKLDIARKVLTNEAARHQYDLTAARTGPPARAREVAPPMPASSRAATAPPVRRVSQPDRPSSMASRLEILGEPIRILKVSGGTATAVIRIRNGGEGAMSGKAEADVPWMRVQPTDLDPEAVEQDLHIEVDAADIPDNATTAVVTILTEKGERARVVFEVQRRSLAPVVIGVGVLVVVALAVGAGLMLQFL